MKTTKKQFAAFKRSFLHWQKELGMVDYKIDFQHGGVQSERAAEIGINHEGRCAVVAMCDSLTKDDLGFDPVLHGKHEAIHLMLGRLASLAHSRYVLSREIYDAEEGIVRVLEKLL
jgi:hypothetical protein